MADAHPATETKRQQRFLITGTAGFIGFHVARRLLADGHLVDGIDGMTPYFDVALKQKRHAILSNSNAFRAHEVMLEDSTAIAQIAAEARPEVIIDLAAPAGIRYSLEHPRASMCGAMRNKCCEAA